MQVNYIDFMCLINISIKTKKYIIMIKTLITKVFTEDKVFILMMNIYINAVNEEFGIKYFIESKKNDTEILGTFFLQNVPKDFIEENKSTLDVLLETIKKCKKIEVAFKDYVAENTQPSHFNFSKN